MPHLFLRFFSITVASLWGQENGMNDLWFIIVIIYMHCSHLCVCGHKVSNGIHYFASNHYYYNRRVIPKSFKTIYFAFRFSVFPSNQKRETENIVSSRDRYQLIEVQQSDITHSWKLFGYTRKLWHYYAPHSIQMPRNNSLFANEKLHLENSEFSCYDL